VPVAYPVASLPVDKSHKLENVIVIGQGLSASHHNDRTDAPVGTFVGDAIAHGQYLVCHFAACQVPHEALKA
jgi:hypothetical protein